MKNVILRAVLVSACSLGAASAATYDKGAALEKVGKYAEAAKAYEQAAALGGPQAESALFRAATVYDQKVHDPGKAWALFNKYVNAYPNTRGAGRAKVRLESLTKYKGADPTVYAQYQSIIDEPWSKNRRAKLIAGLEDFLKNNPGVDWEDEAMIWLANEYKGYKRVAPKSKEDKARLEKAIALYKQVTTKFDDPKVQAIAFKNLGDSYLMKQDFQKANQYYEQTIAVGGDYGRLLIGEYRKISFMSQNRMELLAVAAILVPILIGALLFILPLRSWSMAGLRQGLRNALYFLPLAAVGVALLAFWPEGDHHGPDFLPHIIALLSGTFAMLLVLEGVIARAADANTLRRRVSAWLALPLYGALNYILLYKLGLLPHLERLWFT